MKFDGVQALMLKMLDTVFFFLLSLVFVPAFLIVTFLQKYWSKKLGELFD